MMFEPATIEIHNFKLADVPAFYAAPTGAARNAAAELQASVRYERKVKKRTYEHQLHVANAADHLQRLPDDGESIHCVMRGNYHAWDLVPAVLRLAAPATLDYLGVATLGFNAQNATELIELYDAGRIRAIEFICSCFFRSMGGEAWDQLYAGLTARKQPVVAVRSHAKVLLFALSDGRQFVIESSANLRSCRNAEQFAFTRDAGLLEFHRAWMRELIGQASNAPTDTDAGSAGRARRGRAH